MRYSKGIMWLDECRIPFNADDKFDIRRYDTNSVFRMDNPQTTYEVNEPDTKGRFTPNLLVCDDMLNDGVISKSGKNTIRKSNGFNKNAYGIGIGIKEGDNNGEYGDSGSSSRYYDLDKWFDKVIDEIQ
jgi:hypothetical protein